MTDTTDAVETDEPQPDLSAIQERLTPRQTGAWETATGLALTEFPPSYFAALLAWWAAAEDGEPITVDQALDLPLGEVAGLGARAAELLGKGAAAGKATP